MVNDFIEYWAAAKLLLSGGNPYSAEQLLQLQRTVGWSKNEALLMWNPPGTLFFIAPLGLLDYNTGQFLWFVIHFMIIFVCARVLWQTYDGAPRSTWWPLLSALTFAPTYLLLIQGQIGGLILLGLILFLHSVKRHAWDSAGLNLSLVSIKPHLIYLFWLAIAAWSIRERRWKFLRGWLIGVIVTGTAPLFFDPAIYSQYMDLVQSHDVHPPLYWATPSLGTVLRVFVDRGGWVHWLPSVAGAAWMFWYWRRHAESWDWREQLPIVLLVAVVTASFVWTFDQIVLLPAVIQCAVWLSRSSSRILRRLIIAIHILINGGILWSKLHVPNDFWYFWMAPIYLILFFSARWIARPARAST